MCCLWMKQWAMGFFITFSVLCDWWCTGGGRIMSITTHTINVEHNGKFGMIQKKETFDDNSLPVWSWFHKLQFLLNLATSNQIFWHYATRLRMARFILVCFCCILKKDFAQFHLSYLYILYKILITKSMQITIKMTTGLKHCN